MRVYDPRIGKFLSVDPLTQKYPYFTPYQFASNSPISGIDLDGEEYLNANESLIQLSVQYNTKLQKLTSAYVFYNMENITQATRNALEIRPVNHCENCFVAKGGNVSAGALVYKDPLTKTSSEASMEDVPAPKSVAQPEVTTLNIPSNKREAREIERTKKFELPSGGVATGTAKGHLSLLTITLVTNALQNEASDRIKNDVNIAAAQAQKYSKEIFSDLKFALDNKLVNFSLLNDVDLSDFANYLLYGKVPEKSYVLKNRNGDEYFPTDSKKLAQFQKLDADIQKRKAEQKSNNSNSTSTQSN